MGLFILGTEIGGTFTDLVALDTETGTLKTVKVPTKLPKYIDGAMKAVKRAGIAPPEISLFKHGSTASVLTDRGIQVYAMRPRRGKGSGIRKVAHRE